MVEFMVIVSMWESMAAWFTPTILFCVANFIIATIFIASNKHDDRLHVHGDSSSLSPIVKMSSFLDRSRSMNLSSYITAESQHQSPSQSIPANYSSSSRLAQSIYASSNYVSPSELSKPEGYKVLSQPGHAPSLFERVKSIKFYYDYSGNMCPVELNQVSNSPGEFIRAPSFLDRVKSFKIASAFKSEPVLTQTGNIDPDPSHNPDHHVIRSKSERKPMKKLSMEMKKSRSEVRITPDEDNDVDFDKEVDAKADDFISRFKHQLKLQRLESLVRYKDMLNQ